MWDRIVFMAAIVTGVVLAAGMVLAQTAGPSLPLPPPSIVPVTGPSTGGDLSEAAKPPLVTETSAAGAIEGARTSAVTPAAANAPAPRAVKVVHKPGAKAAVKKASGSKHAKVAGKPAKTKQIAATKRPAPTGHTVSGKPATTGKRPAPAKGGAPSAPVLPRV